MPRSTILIVEDEPKISQLLVDYLQQTGYETRESLNYEQICGWVEQEEINLILLDWMLPGMSGLEICQQLRTISTVPILMVTARVEEIDCLKGLDAGADDYICKPFSPREVVARVKAVLRRTYHEDHAELTAGPIHLDQTTHQVWVDESEVVLTPNEFGVLKVLLQKPGKVWSRESLLQQVQGYQFNGYDRTIDTHVKNLRKKLATYNLESSIVTVYGIGYRFQLLEHSKDE
jgi:two-component system response regulator BaeR|tara:strand:+ start:16 stop:711 length:696 start_codon:yes stop_codon:yes gene_type:complete